MAYQVAVCGPRGGPDAHQCTDTDAANAYRVGQLLAEREAVVICGGGTGVMAAVAAGARSRNGLVVGILPGGSREQAATGLSVTIATNMGEARNAIIVGSADAVIVVGGSWGTLSEIALAKRRGDVPVVSLGGWQIRDSAGRPVPGIDLADTPEAATELAFRGPGTTSRST